MNGFAPLTTYSSNGPMPEFASREDIYTLSSPDVTTGMLLFETCLGADGQPDMSAFLVTRFKLNGEVVAETLIEAEEPVDAATYHVKRYTSGTREFADSGLALGNPNAFPVVVRATLRNGLDHTCSVTLDPGEQASWMLAQVFSPTQWDREYFAANDVPVFDCGPWPPELPADLEGSLEFTSSTGGFVGLAYNLSFRSNGEFTFSTIPMGPGRTP